MAPPGNSDELASSKKVKKSNSKEERKHKKGKHERPAASDEAPTPRSDAKGSKGKKRKHKDGEGEKEHGKRSKERKGEGEAAEARRGDDKVRRAMEDERFAAARTDPRFRAMRRKEAKVELDSRFTSMLTDPRFSSSSAPVDKHGRRRRKKGGRENPMLQYYLNQEEEEEKEKAKLVEEEEEEGDAEEQQGEEESSSSDDDDDDEDEEEDDDDEYSVGSDIAHYLMGRHDDTPMIDKETHRLAVVNMDWDHIKAVDLYMVMTSCLPKGGRVLSVSVYPSEFGLERMKIESTKGPAALVDVNGSDGEYSGGDDDDDDEEEEDSSDTEHDSEAENNKLRTYELNRLRYYYAVVVCDSSATANHLYMNLDGTELLKTSNVFDLQFIPDSMEFKHPARDVATEAPPSYKEPNFETRALQHSKVKLTWDDDEPERKKVLRRKFTDDQLDDLDMYLASDDSASDDEGADNHGDESLQSGAKRKLTREERLALLLQGDKSEEEQTDGEDMEITFNTELEDLSKRILDRKVNNEKTVWEKHQEKMKEKRKSRKRRSKDDDDDGYSSEDGLDEHDDFFDDEMSDEEIKPNKKQKAKAKDKGKGKGKDKLPEQHLEDEATREELELLVAADKDAGNGAKGYNLKRKKGTKGKKGKEQSVEDELPDIDLSKDERFSAMFNSHWFAVDPTDPQYKRSAAFMRKQAGIKGAHEPSLGGRGSGRGTLPPDDVPTDTHDQKPDGTSTEKLETMSAVKSLKRKLTALKNTSKSDR
ncbi:pre-rRNA-processing protein ESF1 [Oryza sativa Japonica Group]|nr:pre-rRNA-processing protein ESF1 [Oryza sativa Japonica Group]KAF2923174.1 hypothetical protein DAI22_07g170400 [Oryza sativa Japonica Group]